MTTAVDNIDDLEALLAGLDEDELNSLTIDDDVAEAELVEEPVKKAPPKRKLKPLADTKPPVEPTSEADLEAELSDLDLDESEASSPKLVALLGGDKDALSEEEHELLDTGAGLALNQDDEQKDLEHLGIATAAEVLLEMQDEPEPEVPAEVPAEVKPADDDLAIEALLAASSAAAPADPTAAATSSIKPKSTVRPTFSTTGPLKTFIDADKLQDDLNFTTTNISLAMTRQASLFAHYSRFSAEATFQSDRCKQQVDLLYANLDQQFRDSMTTAGTKFTEKTLESMIIKDGSYQEAQTRAHEARAIAKMVETTAESFKHRKDMLIQVGADLRQEKSGSGLVVREHPGAAATRNM